MVICRRRKPIRVSRLHLEPLAALVITAALCFPGSSAASHTWGYPEVIFLDALNTWVSGDRDNACVQYKNAPEMQDKWGFQCEFLEEWDQGNINRGCSSLIPGNTEGRCESNLVFCRLHQCEKVVNGRVDLGMTAFRCETHGYYYDFTTDTCGIPQSKPGKERGVCKPAAGNPCNPVTGNKLQRETDYTGAGPFPLQFQRFYNSIRVGLSKPGADWRHTYERSIHTGPVSLVGSEAEVVRSDGQILIFSFTDGEWKSDPDVRERLEEELDTEGIRTGWRLTDADDTVERYDASGRLVAITNRKGFTQTVIYDETSGLLKTVTDPFGRELSFSHGASGLLESVTDPAGNVYRYDYDGNANLVAVVFPDGTPADASDNPQRVYHYEDARFPYHLTGVTDENGSRYSTYVYDAEGRAVSSELAGGANAITISYNADGTSTVTDALGNETVYTVESIFGVRKTTEFDQPCVLCQNKNAVTSYDENGFPASTRDFNGNLTIFDFNERGLELSRTEAAGTPEARTIATEWHPEFRRPVRIIGPGREITFTYDAVGRLLTRTVTDSATAASRTTTRTYTPEGLLAGIDGPRTDVTDVTTFEYDVAGNLIKTVDALGRGTSVAAYDDHGRPLTLVDPNGAITELGYDARNRLISREVAGSLTRFDYDGTGNVVRVTLPDGSFLSQEYDDAHRLSGVSDNLGNRVAYTLDALGNRIAEQTFDPGGVLTRSMSRVYNVLNRLTDEIGSQDQTTHFAYDAQGNVIAVTDPNNQWTVFSYDALNRLVETIAPDDGVTRIAYDDRDNLAAVTDPRSLETRYAYNGFDEVIETNSPDTGSTVQTHDEAGNRTGTINARGIDVTFEYDVLNRLIAIRYPDPAEDVTFEYDRGQNAIGRLTRISDQAGSIEMSYDARGNMIAEIRTIDETTYATRYAYDTADRLVEMAYPSGLVVRYERDALGRVSSVNAIEGGVLRQVASRLEYAPFGPRTALTFGNGIQMIRILDEDYRLVIQRAGAVQDLTYVYDPASNIMVIQDSVNPIRDQSFGYDGVNRLTSAQGSYGNRGYAYDQVGNRLARSADGDSDTYLYSNTANQLESITGPNAETFVYDAAGNTIQKGPVTFVYNDANRLQSAQASSQILAEYTYNAKGERVKKVTAGEITVFHYDQAGHLISEFDGEGNPLRDYVWLDGERLAVVVPSRPDLIFTEASPGGGNEIRLGLFLEEKIVEIEDSHGLSGSYALKGRRWELGEDGVLRLKFSGDEIRFRGSLNLDTLEGVFAGRADGEWHAYQVAGEKRETGPEGLFFIHSDHLGTPKAITDEAQRVVWEAVHAPFGTALISVNELESNLRFPGQYFDGETGLHYNIFRDYDSDTGRFLQSDPIGLDGGLNTYAYVLSNSIRFADPDGLLVRFICRPIYGLLDLLGINHCFVYITCPSEGWARVLSFFGDERSGFPPSQGYKYSNDPWNPTVGGDPDLNLGRDDPNSSSNRINAVVPDPIKCREETCGFEKEVLERYYSYPWGRQPYDPLGPNSNTRARDLVDGYMPPGLTGTNTPGINHGYPLQGPGPGLEMGGGA